MMLKRAGKVLLRVVFALFLLPLILLPAQGPMGMGGPGGPQGPLINVKRYSADKELSRITKKYKLSEDQKGKIRPVLEAQEKQVHTLGEDQSLSDAEWVSGVHKVHRETVISVKSLMTEDQAGKYLIDEEKQAKSDAAEERQQQDGPPPGGGGPPPGGGGGPPGFWSRSPVTGSPEIDVQLRFLSEKSPWTLIPPSITTGERL